MIMLHEILKKLREERICKSFEEGIPTCECEARAGVGKPCKKWTQADFAALAGVDVRNYQNWEAGLGFERTNLERLHEKLKSIPCDRRKKLQPDLESWELHLLNDLDIAIQRGPKPRDINASLDRNLLSKLRSISSDGAELSGLERKDLEWTIDSLSQSPDKWLGHKIPSVSRTICLFEDRLREVGCNAQSILKFSAIAALRTAAQIAINQVENDNVVPWNDPEPFERLLDLLKEALQEAKDVLSTRSSDLNNTQKLTLNDAIEFFDLTLKQADAMPKTADAIYLDSVSLLCDEVCQIAAKAQQPDYFRDVLEIMNLKAKSAPPKTLFADAEAPEMIVMPFPATVEIGTSENEVYLSDLKDPIPSREQPVIEARMNGKFSIGRFPVTVDQYSKFCRDVGRSLPKENKLEDRSMPVVGTNWYDATDYCNWLSAQFSQPYRLPSEVEWEFACRAIKYADTSYYYGDEIDEEDAVFADTGVWGPVSTTARHFRPNGFGLYFMHGNVWEWCEDEFEGGYSSGRTQAPFEVDGVTNRVARGGCWAEPAHLLRSGSRFNLAPKTCSELVGFRVVRDLL